MELIFASGIGYLLGSISFGILTSRLLHRDDIRHHGSGNAGMTNALRTYGSKTAVLVFIGDFLKGALAVWLGGLVAGGEPLGGLCAALFVVVGHLFPVFFGFRGGKGVATAAGAILMLNPLVLAVLLVPFGLITLFTRYMSLASVTVAGLFPFVMAGYQLLLEPTATESWVPVIFAAIMGALVIYMHRANIVRLIKGTESKLGQKK